MDRLNLDYDHFVADVIKQVRNIYTGDAIPQNMDAFIKFFTSYTLNTAYRPHIELAFGSGGNIPTLNARQALIASNISPTGKLPLDYSFTIIKSMDPNLLVLAEQQSNSQLTELEQNIQNVYHYIQQEPNTDPNAYELVYLFTMHHNLKCKQKEISPEAHQQLEEIWKKRKQDFIDRGIGKDSTSYQICNQCYEDKMSNNILEDVTIEALKKLAAIDLYVGQQKRDNGNISYDNVKEIDPLKNYFSASQLVNEDMVEPYLDRLQDLVSLAHTNQKKNQEKDR